MSKEEIEKLAAHLGLVPSMPLMQFAGMLAQRAHLEMASVGKQTLHGVRGKYMSEALVNACKLNFDLALENAGKLPERKR